jgi:hypothetical protein
MSFASLLRGRGRPSEPTSPTPDTGGGQPSVQIDPDTAMTIRSEAAEFGVVDYASALMSNGLSADKVRDLVHDAGNRRSGLVNLDTNGAALAAFDQVLASGRTPHEAGAAAMDALASTQSPDGAVQSRITPDTGLRSGDGLQTYDNPNFLAQAAGEALYLRLNPGTEPSQAAAGFMGASIVDVLRHANTRFNVKMNSQAPDAVVGAALQGNGDFVAALTGDLANRAVREAYQPAPSSLVNLSREREARDFRAQHLAGIGQMPPLEKVSEHGEFRYGSLSSEGGELLRVQTFGKILGLTRQAIVNDDLQQIVTTTQKVSTVAADFINSQIADLLKNNPVFFDGKSLFHADHNNLAASGGDITVAALSEARKALRTMMDVSGQVAINIQPALLIVHPNRETEAEQVLSTVQAAQTGNVNPFAGTLRLLVDPRLESEPWYVAGDPIANPAIYHAYLSGARGPQVETRTGFEYDGVQIRIRMDFGCGVGDFRPIFKNAGS